MTGCQSMYRTGRSTKSRRYRAIRAIMPSDYRTIAPSTRYHDLNPSTAI
jgi:hypothetical protein